MTVSWRSAIQAMPDLLDLIESITLDRRRVPLFGDDVATRCGAGPALPEVDSHSRTWLNGMRDGRLVQVELRARDRNVLEQHLKFVYLVFVNIHDLQVAGVCTVGLRFD